MPECQEQPDVLECELRTYAQHKDSLLAKSPGKFVLIKGDEVVGAYESEMDAIAQGYDRFGNVPFLVKRVVDVESPANFVNNHVGY